jgi:carbamate kinase
LKGAVRTAVVAIGGNALLPPNGGDIESQRKRIDATCSTLVDVLRNGYEMVITHGNGPQVGNLLEQNELARRRVGTMTLDVCVAQTQAQIGYQLQQSLANVLKKKRIPKSIVTIVTQVIVNPRDRAFRTPTKPIGPTYSKTRAKELMRRNGWKMVLDPRGGYRRLVPSPEPLEIVEKDAIVDVLEAGDIAIAVGGGGIPVVRKGKGLMGIEAVVDKDFASSLLASDIGADLFVIVTDVDSVSLNYNTHKQVDLDVLKLKDAKKYLRKGQFPPGSMGPKIESAIEFLEHERSLKKKVIVSSIDSLSKALAGKAGTLIEV